MRIYTRLVIWAFIIALLITGGITAKNHFYKITEREVPRLTSDDPQLFRQAATAIKSSPADYTVVFIGDSAVYSSVAREDKRTVASYFATAMARRYPLKEIAVFDLSLPGCSFPATYELTKYLLNEADPDLIIADVNPGWLGSDKMEHLVLQDLNTGRQTPKNDIAPVPKFPDELYRPWFEKDFSHLKDQPKLGAFRALESNRQWTAYKAQAALFAGSNTTCQAVFFLPPRNRELYEKYDLIEDDFYNQQVGLIEAQIPERAVFADYTWSIDSSLFSDLTHMFPDGNKKLADFLASQVVQHRLLK